MAIRPAVRRGVQVLLLAVAVVLAGYALVRLKWRLEETYPLVKFERTRVAQQFVSLRQYSAREKLGFFLPPGDAQIAIGERLLRDVLTRSMPIRQTLEGGRYEARLDRARLELDDGLASITMFGHVMRVDAKRKIEAQVELQTHIDVVEFRPDVGTLRAGLSVTGAHVVRAGRGAAKTFMNPAARFFGGLKVEDWNRERLSLDIPIRLDQEITIPDRTGEVSLEARRIPLRVRVSALTVLQNRLVLSLFLEPDGSTGKPPAMEQRGRVMLTPHFRKRMEREVRRLFQSGHGKAARNDILRRVRALAARDSLWRGIMESDRDVVAIVPKPMLQTLCNRVARSYLQAVRLDFDPSVVVRLNEPIRVRVLGGNVGAGRIVGNLRVTHLQGRLRVTSDPVLVLIPPNGFELRAPVRVQEGQGRVALDMRWDPSLLVSVVCRGFGFKEALTGEVLPFSHVLQTRIRMDIDGSKFVGRPLVRAERVIVPCEFTPASYGKVRTALLAQDRLLRCGLVMDADTVLSKVQTLVRRNVRFRIPRTLFKPFSLPVSLKDEYTAGDFRIAARVRNPEVAVRSDYLRLGFGAELEVRNDEQMAPTGEPIPKLKALPPDTTR
jgi:hypothetical protein